MRAHLPRYVTPIAMEDTPNTSVRSFLSFFREAAAQLSAEQTAQENGAYVNKNTDRHRLFFFIMVRAFMISLTRALSTTVATVAGMYTVQKE